MKIKQFEDEFLAHYSYAILSECEAKVVLIDPSRNPDPYYAFAKEHHAQIIAVIETHSHADFVSSHLEISEATGADIYASHYMDSTFDFNPFDEGNVLTFGKIVLKAINTPGHSEDSISILLEHEGSPKYLFSGDTLFIGDCGRPDLRGTEGNVDLQREKLAIKMYHSLHQKLKLLPDHVILYPAHGAGTLCGKALRDAKSSTMGEQKRENWSLQEKSEEAFVRELTTDQPFIPAYFPFDVELNKKGALPFKGNVEKVKSGLAKGEIEAGDTNVWVIDSRNQEEFKKGHFAKSMNIMDGAKFETWLGSMIDPSEEFYLVARDEATLSRLIERTASIGYETKIKATFVDVVASATMPELDIQDFRNRLGQYTIIDVRNPSEVMDHPIFAKSMAIPLADLNERIKEIPMDKPIAVHCAGGYRSAIGSSLIAALIGGKQPVYDIGEHINEFDKSPAPH